jgi:hypothetical protein
LAIGAMLFATAAAAHAETVRVTIDQARAISLPESASGVAVGNPDIAAVTVQHDRLLFVMGRSYGSTNLVVVDRAGRQMMDVRLTVVPDENSVVLLTKGSSTQRFECTPQCRRRPDMVDDAQSYSEAQSKLPSSGGAAPQ